MPYISKNFNQKNLHNIDNKLNLQQNNVCSVEKFTQVWKFYTTAGCEGCEILHVCDGIALVVVVVLVGIVIIMVVVVFSGE